MKPNRYLLFSLALITIFGCARSAVAQEEAINTRLTLEATKAKLEAAQGELAAAILEFDPLDVKIEPERTNFKELLLSNPNYFGNLEQSDLEAVKVIQSNTKYEQLMCVGFRPRTDELEATIHIKLPYGYGGNLCQAGTQEYVRFYLNYGSGWEDVGVTAIKVHDIPNQFDCQKRPTKPLSYAARLRIKTKKKPCSTPVLPRARGILSWNTLPPPNQPNWKPVWGNVLQCNIQILDRTLKIVDLSDLFKKSLIDQLKLPADIQIKLPPELIPISDQSVPQPEPVPLNVSQLAELYKETDVETHRFAASEIDNLLSEAELPQSAIVTKAAEWEGLGLNWPEVSKKLVATKANTSYEELECVGLEHTGYQERLVATFRVKRPSGYGGNLCQFGSIEYVAFWADWNDTCKWQYIGTAKVRAHDFRNIPKRGLCYTAVLPVDLTKYRRPCTQPKIARVRAVLSWAVPPSTTDPNKLNYYGNRLDRHVQIKPGPIIVQPKPVIGVLGGIPVEKINNASGLTTSDAFFALNGHQADSLGRPCPFGRRVVVQGPLFPGLKYRVQVKKVSDPWTSFSDVTTKLMLTDETGTVFTPVSPVGGYYEYVDHEKNVDNVLTWWDTSGDDIWHVKLDIQGVPTWDLHRVQLDNTRPTTEIHIDSGGDCKDFTVQTIINGKFVARDPYFGSFNLATLPFGAPAGQLVPSSGTSHTAVAPGNPWKLDTKNMKPCGYVVRVYARDRSILNSVSGNHHDNSSSVGLCLRKEE